MRALSLALFALSFMAAPVAAYDVLLDIDIDKDPSTLRTEVDADSATVWLVLRPTDPGEWFSDVTFGLGGTCWECWQEDVPYTYGTDCDLFWTLTDWHGDNPLFESSWADISLCYGCCGGSGPGDGYHYLFSALAAGGGFALTEPVFLVGFGAWVSRSSIFERCPHPPANLITFPNPFGGPDAEGNEILIGDEFTPARGSSWGAVKALYR